MQGIIFQEVVFIGGLLIPQICGVNLQVEVKFATQGD
jgi:hypothetical protein